MSLNASLTKSLLMAASIGVVVPVHVRSAGAKDSEAKVSPDSGEESVLPVTPAPGIILPRKNGGFVALAVEGGNFVLRFMDEKKRQIAPDAALANARWHPNAKLHEERVVLLPNVTPNALTGNRFVGPPLLFKAYVTLIDADSRAIESFVFEFKK